MTMHIVHPDQGDLAAPATGPEPDAGLGALATSKGNLPLETLDVRAFITGTTASIELAQGFRNPFSVPLEATYIFPLPDRAAVTEMRMEAAGHVVQAVLKERAQARADYDMAVAQGRRAAIAEEDRPDVFTMRVGNIVAGEQVTVRLRLAQPLPFEDGEITFRFPLVIAPRYIPGCPLDDAPAGSGVATDTGAVPDASRISPPVLLPGFPNPVRLSLTADIDPAGLTLAGIRCGLHATVREAGPDGRTVVALRPGERLDRDFILRLAVADQDHAAPSLVLTPDAGPDPQQGTFLLTLLPPGGQAAPRPRDVVLLLDRSGSMTGWKVVAARRAAARIVDTLTAADRFAVLCFDHQVERPTGLPDGLAEATDRNRFRAVEHLSGMFARGGTEMLDPLDRAVRLLAGPAPETGAAREDGSGRDRVLVLITDGQVGNEDQILRHLGSRLAGIRVHAVGIDQAAGVGFLSRLASIGGGRCELVESEDRLDAAAARIHQRIGTPLVTGLTLSADGLAIVPETIAPSRLPDLFPGVPLTVAGRWQGRPGGVMTVRGTAADGQPFEAKATAVTGGSPAGPALWARAHLRDLEDRYASRAVGAPAELDRLEQQITSVSLRHAVLCRFTAFVATDTRTVTSDGTPHRVTQPVEFPAGWDPAAFGLPPSPGPAMPLMAAAGPGIGGKTPMRAPAGADATAAPAVTMRPRGGQNASRAQATAVTPTTRRPGRVVIRDEDAHEGDQARRQMTGEVAALRAARHEPESERRRLLSDLASRLDALVASLAGTPSLREQRAALARLAGRLHDCDQPAPPAGPELDMLWDEAVAQLAAFAEGRWPAVEGPMRRDQRFWKRQT